MPINIGMLSTAFAARPFDAFFIEADATSYAGIRVAGLFGVFCLLIVIAAFRRNDDAPSLRSLIGPGLGVLAVTMTIATCSGYDPISCDLASPFTIDLIALAAALSCMVGLWRGSWPLIITFGVLSILARPTPILVVSVAGVACWLTRVLDMRTCLRRFGVTLALFALTIWIYQTTLQSEATESSSFLSRLRFLTLTDIGRLRFLVLPAGLISAVALVLPRKLDREGRALLITCWVVFAFFAVQSFFTLHHFLLPMFLPVLIFWRSELKNNKSLAASAMIGSLTVIVALTLYAPPTHHQLKDLSLRVAFDLPQAERDHATLDRASEVLHVVTSTQNKTIESYRHALARILLMEAPSQPTDDTEILIIPITGTPPDGWAIAELNDAYIRLERTDRPIHELSVHEVPYAHPLLAIPLEHQFRHIGESRGNFDIDLRQVLPWSR
jgi:hypothetical protein